MPELPEVETVKRGLAKLIVDKTITSVNSNWEKSFPNAPSDVEKFVIGAKITKVKRRAKVLMIELNTKYTLLVHLKMTGQLVFVGQQKPKSKVTSSKSKAKKEVRPAVSEVERFGAGHPSDSLIGKLPDKSTRVIFTFSDGSNLFFNDQRKFGWVRLFPTAEVPNIDFFQKLGPEPLSKLFTSTEFIERMRKRSNSVIKAALLDQTIIAGIGNIYADESLFAARIHPARRVKDVSDNKLEELLHEIRQILRTAIKSGGSSDRNYVDAEGKKGSYLSFAKVFRREGKPCQRCGTAIIKTRVAGRGTHVCPRCQKIS